MSAAGAAGAAARATATSRLRVAVVVAGLLGAASAARAQGEAGEAWAIEVSERLELAPGEVGAAVVILRGKGRYAVARSGLRVDLAPSAKGISVRQRRYQRGEAAEPEAAAPRFSIPVRAEAAGSYALEVRVRFWVCAARSCLPVDERRAVVVDVRAPPPPPEPPVAAPVAPEPPKPARPARPAPRPPPPR